MRSTAVLLGLIVGAACPAASLAACSTQHTATTASTTAGSGGAPGSTSAQGSGAATSGSTGASAGGADAGSGGSAGEQAAIQQIIDEAVAPAMGQAGAVGMVVGVIDGPNRVFAAYGEVVHGSGTKPTEDTLFEIGSNTKCFTATLLASAVDAGTVTLSDTLEAYMPAAYQFAPGTEKLSVTLLELADHTSGFQRNPDDVPAGATTFSIDQVYEDADTQTLATPPGQKYAYSNLGFALLGYALADKAGTTWGDLVQTTVTGPLGMPDTALYAQLDAAQLARAAQGYDTSCGTPCPVSQTLVLAAFPAPGIDPAGSLWSSGTDMMTWLSYNMGLSGPPGLVALLPMLRQPRVTAGTNQEVGLAWNSSSIGPDGGAVEAIWKPGDTNGFHSYVGYVPSRGLGVLVMENFLSTSTPMEIGDQILAALL